jgi:hypothetical protein
MRFNSKNIHNFAGMKRNNGRLAGILGTVIFHLLAAVIFMSFQIRTIQKENQELFRIEFEDPPEAEPEEEKIEVPLSTLEKILQGDNEMLNIARNLANKADPTVNREDYIDRVKEELIKNGLLDKNNYIDEWREKALNGDEKLAMEKEQPKTIEEEKPTASQELASNFQGPTRIYYDLEGRTHTYLPIPIYKCEGAGKITVSIVVSLKGIVEDAKVISGESTTTNPCLIETAIQTALQSRFNADVNAPRTQKGTISYHFVAQ